MLVALGIILFGVTIVLWAIYSQQRKGEQRFVYPSDPSKVSPLGQREGTGIDWGSIAKKVLLVAGLVVLGLAAFFALLMSAGLSGSRKKSRRRRR